LSDAAYSIGGSGFALMFALGVKGAPVAELVTAKGTVVDRKTKEYLAKRVVADPIDPVERPHFREITVIAERAARESVEDGQRRPVKTELCVALIAPE
jgi:hypothetical protein